MKKILVLLITLMFCLNVGKVNATYDPTTKPNNIFGIHILFPSELSKASELVNSNGGQWGYVTIPIQYEDRDLEKWQKFMDDAAQNKITPILRLATSPYYKNTAVWRVPEDSDILDFANFLNSLEWPTKNRYVLLFNEVNRFDEWGGGTPNPARYADFVSYAVDTFKSRSNDFFVIAGGFDNASPNDGHQYLDNLVFIRQMGLLNPEVFKKIDGFASHSYPNPNFAQPPSKTKQEGTSTYRFESEIVNEFAESQKPIFITETGWNAEVLPQSVIAKYFEMTMTDIWGQDKNIIAVTPFVLESQGGPFDKFTFIKGGQFTEYAKAYQSLKKVKGEPIINSNIDKKTSNLSQKVEQSYKFNIINDVGSPLSSPLLRNYLKTLVGLGGHT